MELTLDQALKKGIEAHKAGEVQEADRYYTAILKAQPKHPDANHNMGVLAVGVGKVQEALPFFKTALEANSSIAQFWLSYIDALIKLDRLADADPQIRAERRANQLEKILGIKVNKSKVLEEINERDELDKTRAICPLHPAEDSVIIDTSELSIDNVVSKISDRIIIDG